MKSFNLLFIALACGLSAIPFTMHGAQAELDAKKAAALDEEDLKAAHAMVFGGTHYEHAPAGIRQIINDFAEECSEIYGTDIWPNDPVGFGTDSQGNKFLSFVECAPEEVLSEGGKIPSKLDLQTLNVAQTKSRGTPVGPGQWFRFRGREEVEIVREDGSSQTFALNNLCDSWVQAHTQNTIVYTPTSRYLTGGLRNATNNLVLEHQHDGVRIFQAAIRKRAGETLVLQSTLDRQGACLVASSLGHLWNAQNPAQWKNVNWRTGGYAPPVDQRGFLLRCNKDNEPQAMMLSSSTPGKFYCISLPDGKVRFEGQQATPIAQFSMCGHDRMVTGDKQGAVRVWELGASSCMLAHELEYQHKNHVVNITATQDGSHIAAIHAPNQLRVWKRVSPLLLALEKIKSQRLG